MLLGLAIAGLYAVGAPALPGLFTADVEVRLLRITANARLMRHDVLSDRATAEALLKLGNAHVGHLMPHPGRL